MDVPHKLKVKIGMHEFDGEGDPQLVQAQYADFKKMVESHATSHPAERAERGQSKQLDVQNSENKSDGSLPALERILKVEDRIVSMTASTRSIRDVILILMLGQKILRQNDLVTGAELTDGLRTSGHSVARVDYTMGKIVDEGYVIKVGARRASKYRFTNPGIIKATDLAKELIGVVG